jgi:dTDP-4-dehydrorhamnose 3,5-epimerase-like enzyme
MKMNVDPKQVCKGEILGVLVKDLIQNVDDRGILYETCRVDWEEYKETMGIETIQQVYTVINETDAIRAFHKHEYLIDFIQYDNDRLCFNANNKIKVGY